jgi:hypothetical protein
VDQIYCRTKIGTKQKKNRERQESACADREAKRNTTQAEHEPRRQENGSEQENLNGLAATVKINRQKNTFHPRKREELRTGSGTSQTQGKMGMESKNKNQTFAA